MRSNDFFSSKSVTLSIVSAYSDFISQKISEGWSGYLLTFMFEHMNGSTFSIMRRMELEIERCYATMVTRIVRKPTSLSKVGRLPIWICCPDRPVPKSIKDKLDDIAINNGLHYHAVCLIPPINRLKEELHLHVGRYQSMYARRGSLLRELQVEVIQTNPSYVSGYSMKSLSRRWFNPDQLLVLPRSSSEVR